MAEVARLINPATQYSIIQQEEDTGPGEDGLGPDEPVRGCVFDIVENQWFQVGTGVVIIMNAIIIGGETDYPHLPVWQIFEDFFIIVFVTELVLRLSAYGLKFFAMGPDFWWNMFDFMMVIVGVLDRSAEILIVNETKKQGRVGFFATLLRMFRLLRIVRIFRIFRMLKQLYMLVHGFIEAASAVFWVSILCALCLYVCAIVLTRVLGRPAEDDAHAEFFQEHFGSIFISMLSLFELMAHPNMEEYRVVTNEFPNMTAFFIAFIIFGSFAMVSLLTGVISETMFEKSQMRQDERRFERERARKKFLEQVKVVFLVNDADGNGSMDKEEFTSCIPSVIKLFEAEGLAFSQKDLETMFDMVDYDGSGTIDIDEFLYGMAQLAEEVRPMSIMELRCLLVRGFSGIHDRIRTIDTRIQNIEAACEGARK